MGKVLIASFDREEEQDFEELVLFLKEKGYKNFTSMALRDKTLKYDNLEINPKYRTVRKQGEDIELTNYEFDILYLLAKRPGQVFSKEQIYSQVWKEPYCGGGGQCDESDSENTQEDRARAVKTSLYLDGVGNRV